MKQNQTTSAETSAATPLTRLEDLAIKVSAVENRPVSFTNKRSGYYYTQTHDNNHAEHAWFSGFNLAQKRLFSDYEISIDGKVLNRPQAKVSVYPHKLVRTYPDGTKEQLSLFDDQDIVRIGISATNPGTGSGTDSGANSGAGHQLSLTLLGDQLSKAKQHDELITYRSKENPGKVIAVAPIQQQSDAPGQGFYVLIADDVASAVTLLKQVRQQDNAWQQQREQRMLTLLNDNTPLQSSDKRLTKAIQWQMLNLNSLMTNQHGKGIYAGLPWFNEYWGRDSFIALPGASLVTGQFEFARDMITAFARYQDRDPQSTFFGRVPNRVRVEDIDYHTTDGTPRFVIEMLHYVQYSGDVSLIEQLYPNVKDSIDGSLKNWVDSKGYLLHADNETWMDARREPDKVPYSPRGTRANDIQALWFEQLKAGIYFAKFVDDKDATTRWQQALNKLQKNFSDDFVLSDVDYLADHLNSDNSADRQLRPNQFYAFDLIEDKTFVTAATKTAWQQLVYPWGVASLDNRDNDFHPYHLTDTYHKDAAYHNGTVWLWNNGIAMQRMIEAGQPDLAYQLFANMNEQALTKGVVGGLAENADAYPHAGHELPTITGTYLQAWSNAEQLRIWYQTFLGIRPDLMKQQITFAPRMPSAIDDVNFQVRIGKGKLTGAFRKTASMSLYHITNNAVSGTLVIDIPPYPITEIMVKDNMQISIVQSFDTLQIVPYTQNNEALKEIILHADTARLDHLETMENIMENTTFAKPLPLKSHRVID
ncbi:amylo-alpha-1,6-glucosidase [Thalassotalea litorea]|uniref:amylo-alpha-1,6-glucosidase n=1 Tax=Thalassotalea litorea TaxID=2020715 RepID=UPI003735BB44